MSTTSPSKHPKFHVLHRRMLNQRNKSISDVTYSEEQEGHIQFPTAVPVEDKLFSLADQHRRSRPSLKSHHSSSTSDMSKSSLGNLNNHRSSSRSLNSRRSRNLSSTDRSSSSSKRRRSSRPVLKSHRSSSTGDLSRHSTSSSTNRRRKTRPSSNRSASTCNLFSEESSKPKKSGASNIRELKWQPSSSSLNDLSAKVADLESDEPVVFQFEESSEPIKFGSTNIWRSSEHSTSSLSDLSLSETDDSDGFDYDDLVEFEDNEEFYNSSCSGFLGVIAEDRSLDGSVEIEFCFKDNRNERRTLGPKQNSRRSMSSTVTVEDRMRVDEAFMSYTRVEKAALLIQTNFRRKKEMQQQEKQEDAGMQKDESDTDEEKGSVSSENDSESQSEDKDWYAMIFIAVFAMFQTILCLCQKSSDVDVPAVDPATTTTFGGGGGGGGGGGAAPPPPGLEAMAGQAAASAGSSAGSGVAAGASAGAAAGATSAGATAAATGAATATATTQAVAAVAVTSAVATAASTTGILTPVEVAQPFITRCGLVDPQVRVGKFAMVFEGFSRTLDGRESVLLEGLVLNSYNNLTIGKDLNGTGTCLDPLSREMQDVKIKNQTYVPLPEGSSFLEVLFETSVVCDKCSASRPLFKNEKEGPVAEEQQQQEKDDIYDEQEQVEEEEGKSPNQEQNSTRLLGRKQNKRRLEDQGQLLEDQLQDQVATFDESGADFFHRLIQKVVFETEELSKEGELPEGFVSVAQAYVTPTPIENGAMDENEATANGSTELEDALVTTVKYQNQDGKGAFEFSYVDENTGSSVTEVVVSDPADPLLNPIPSTPFPTFAPTMVVPSREPSRSPTGTPTITFSGQPTFLPSVGPTDFPSPVPTDRPSVHPTIFFSGQPTFEPSSKPSLLPSETPTDEPSALPSISPSDIPSYIPSEAPSSVPSIIPSDVPSAKPSQSPSDVPSVIPSESPSMVPSNMPSDMPSVNPSSQPSDVPSTNPSSQPSDVPSLNPSSSPSMVPSDMPSVSMMPSSSPSDVPSRNPSESPSMIPSTVPSDSPSDIPSTIPSEVPSDVPSVSMAPSYVPSEVPSDVPSVSMVPSSTPSANPSPAPTVSHRPSTSVNPTPAPSVSHRPSTSGNYWVVCGKLNHCSHTSSVEDGDNAVTSGGLRISVRCCSDTSLSGFTRKSDCPYAESYIGGTCYYEANYDQAENICASVGSRLCTKDEIDRDCTANTGCNINSLPVWTSTEG